MMQSVSMCGKKCEEGGRAGLWDANQNQSIFIASGRISNDPLVSEVRFWTVFVSILVLVQQYVRYS